MTVQNRQGSGTASIRCLWVLNNIFEEMEAQSNGKLKSGNEG